MTEKMRELTIDRRYQGPFGSINGGYIAGVLGDAVGTDTSSVRLHRPVPVNEPVHLHADDNWAAIRHHDQTLAETVSMPDDIAETAFVPLDAAVSAEDPVFDLGMFADCFVCGRDRAEGLGIRPKPLADGRFVAIWHPAYSGLIDDTEVPARLLRSALDCPGGFAAIVSSGKLAVTGSLTSRVNFLPDSSERLIVVGEAAGEAGRKLTAIATIFTDSQEIVATAQAIWVTLN